MAGAHNIYNIWICSVGIVNRFKRRQIEGYGLMQYSHYTSIGSARELHKSNDAMKSTTLIFHPPYEQARNFLLYD